MRRRDFLVGVGGIVIAVPAVASLAGCSGYGGDDDDDVGVDADGAASCTDFGAGATGSAISSNHGHALAVPAADVNAGVEKTYDIQGTSTHNHQVTITAAQFVSLQSGNSVSVVSTVDGHSHEVTVTCKSG